MKATNGTELCNPPQITWFICWDNARTKIKAYARIDPTQCLETYWTEIDYYLDEAEWLKVLIDNGIDPEIIDED